MEAKTNLISFYKSITEQRCKFVPTSIESQTVGDISYHVRLKL